MKRRPFRLPLISLATLTVFGGLCSCHSPWVQSTVVNQQDTPVKLVEVSYPGGTYGVQTIAAHGSYHYRFRILADSTVSIDFADAAGHSHTAKGPALEEGEQGSLQIDIGSDNKVAWTAHMTRRR